MEDKQNGKSPTVGPKSFLSVGPTLHYSHKNVQRCWLLALGVFSLSCLFWSKILTGAFFSFNPALDDNFIIRDEQLDPFIKDLYGKSLPVYVYKRAWSIAGQIISDYSSGLCSDWLSKLFGTVIPPQSEIYHSNRMNLFVF